MSGIVRVFNLGAPEDAVGPIDFAGHSWVINPRGAQYKLVTKKGTQTVASGNKALAFDTISTVLEKVDGSDGNKINFVDAPAGFVEHIRQGKYADRKTPTGRLYKEILKPVTEVMADLNNELEERRRRADIEIASAEKRAAEIEAMNQQAEERFRALEAKLAAMETRAQTASRKGQNT